MVKKFTANCTFGGQTSPVTLYVGNPAKGSHPLGFQAQWLNKDRGGTIPSNIMDSFAKLVEISEKNRVSFEELCSYVIEEIKSSNSLAEDAKKATSLAPKAKVKQENPVPPTQKAEVKQESPVPENKANDDKNGGEDAN